MLFAAIYNHGYSQAQRTADSVAIAQKPQRNTNTAVKTDSAVKVSSVTALKVKGDSAANSINGTTNTTVPPSANNSWSKPVGWVAIATIVLFFIWLARKRDLLRDAITDTTAFMTAANNTLRYKNATDPNQVKRPYSLSRSQLGVWTLVISCSYIYVEFCKSCQFQGINIDTTLLSLMGISAGTAAAGSMIDAANNQVPHHQDGPSEGFFSDILSDQNGISIHRFQNVIWTLIAIAIYLWQLPGLICGHLPVLDQTLVALTGISSLTYLGLKVNENTPPTPPVVSGSGGPNTNIVSTAGNPGQSPNPKPDPGPNTGLTAGNTSAPDPKTITNTVPGASAISTIQQGGTQSADVAATPMTLVVKRTTRTADSTIGRFSVNGADFCYCLEPADRGLTSDMTMAQIQAIKVPGRTCIPAGTYKVGSYFSPKHQQQVPLLQNVPDFEYIEIHVGNYPADTDGCLLLGDTVGDDFVGESQVAVTRFYNQFFAAINSGAAVSITYE